MQPFSHTRSIPSALLEILKAMNPSAKEHLLERLISTVGRIHDAATALDKTLLSLSGGALVFSMTFVDRLAPLRLCLPLLFLAWALFGASMVSIVFGMRVAHNYLVRQAKEIVDLWNQLNTAES